MKKITVIFLLLISVPAFAQYRDNGLEKPSVMEGIVNQSGVLGFNFLNSDNFLMKHSFSLSYSSFGGQGVSIGTYTNSMYYQLMNNLNIQMDVSFMYSPYSTLGKDFQKNLSGVYISRAAVNYYPSRDMQISLQYSNLPYTGYYYNPYYSFYNGYYGNPFDFREKGEEPAVTK